MMMRGSIRHFSTRLLVDKLFNILQSPSQYEKQIKLGHFIKAHLQQGRTVFPNLINDLIHRWTIEQPTQEALWTYTTNNDECQKLTFNDIYKQSSRMVDVLTGKEYNLQPGKSVLVMLPFSQERILLQLACLRSGLIFCPYDPKDLTNATISQRIQKLNVACVITNEDNLEIVRKSTHNPLRPLKKGLITKISRSEPLPVGWNHLMQSVNNVEKKCAKEINVHSNTPVIRLLSNNNEIIQYSQNDFNLHLLITALWLNINKTSRLIWMKNQNEIISIAPWIFGSSIFYKETEDLKTIFNTLENHPIDTFCASAVNYQIPENQQQENKTHLEQLFSTESIDSTIKTRWHSLTNLHIRDNYGDFNNQSMLKSFSDTIKQKPHPVNVAYHLGPKISSEPIPLKKFAYQYPINQDQMRGKLSRV